ncbi:alkaline phosphatase PhoX [Cryptosporangium aurantiacum]
MTCLYRCGNACAHPAPNESENEYFGDIVAGAVAARLSRRGLLRLSALGAGAVAAGGVLSGVGTELAAAATPAAPRTPKGALTFTPVAPNTADAVTIPSGYKSSVVIRWGEPVLPGAPAFDVKKQTAAAQAQQFGYNNDYVAVIPLDRHGERALLVVNHEYTNEELMFPGVKSVADTTAEHKKIAMAAHGLSVVELERVGDTGQYRPVKKGKRYNRRLTASSKFLLTGPAAGSDLLKTKADPTGTVVLGTLNNCAGGLTPWGTVLSGEENFNQYFVGGNGAPAAEQPALKRYGIDITAAVPSGNRRWDLVDERFDLSKHPHEANRFGWIVELDPFDKNSIPRKRTALGRFKHEGGGPTISNDGHAVVYLGDDERFDYIYKFVSDKKVRRGDTKHNMTLLDSGTLYVGKFSGDSPAAEIDGTGKLPADGAFDGTGTWIPLVRGNESLVEGFTVEQVLINTRLAADKVGATKMDRPEDIERNPVDGKVYVALTNNSNRGATGAAPADEANPRNSNRHGHILTISEKHNDAAAESFTWALPIVCGDPKDASTYFAGYDKTKVSPISCPDNVAFDKAGNLWISTDGNALGSNDGLFATPVSGSEAGHVKQFLTVPKGAETCGPFITPDQKSVFIAVQHPGELEGATLDTPKSVWPDGQYARPAVVVTWRPKGDQRIGS